MRTVSDKRCRENQNTHFVLNNLLLPPFPEVVPLMEKYCRSGQITDDNMAYTLCMSDSEGYRHSLKYVNTYCFFTAIVVTRTRLRLTFIGMPVLILTWGVYGDGPPPNDTAEFQAVSFVLVVSLQYQ
jgi:hypothetical protein